MMLGKSDSLSEVIVLRAKMLPRMAIFTAPMLLICAVGYMLNGEKFFSFEYLSEVDSNLINEYVGFLALSAFMLICVWNIIVLIVSNGVLISVDKNMLILNRVKQIPLDMINANAIKLSRFSQNRMSIGLIDGSSVSLSVAFASTDGDVTDLVKQKISELKMDN